MRAQLRPSKESKEGLARTLEELYHMGYVTNSAYPVILKSLDCEDAKVEFHKLPGRTADEYVWKIEFSRWIEH